jgi:hypothetical protein
MISLVNMKISSVVLLELTDPLFNNEAIWFWNFAKNNLSLVKLLFNAIARWTPTPSTFLNFALSCKSGRDACREFSAMKMFLFRRTIFVDNSLRNFLPNGNQHGISTYKGILGSTIYSENGVEKYECTISREADRTLFDDYKNIISGIGFDVKLIGDIYYYDFGASIRYINIKTKIEILGVRCQGCRQITTFHTMNDENAVVLHRKCDEKIFKFYKYHDDFEDFRDYTGLPYGLELPRSRKCAVIILSKWISHN